MKNTFVVSTLKRKADILEKEIDTWMNRLKSGEFKPSPVNDVREHINTLSKSLEEHRVALCYLKRTDLCETCRPSPVEDEYHITIPDFSEALREFIEMNRTDEPPVTKNTNHISEKAMEKMGFKKEGPFYIKVM